ncbi:alpha/beta hydrolase [Nocardioides ferulae]|uniref:alpha/beta hydrolase n=1 Tax=Nocardioides ferulae TaxID=2340821 RepID=UPI0019826234|nr:alpha/beta hydrolase [Nocardioides ferulae]
MPQPPPYDEECAAALEPLAELLALPVTLEVIPWLRSHLLTSGDDELRLGGAYEVTEHAVPALSGAPDVPLLACLPTDADGPVAAIYTIHGGGMVSGDVRSGVLDVQTSWGRPLGAAVVSVGYRLAPETRHPGPVEDCYAGLCWLADHAGELGIDPGRIVVTGGSAGGGLAAAVALMARDLGGPRLAGQVLMSPMLDDRNDTLSSRQFSGPGPWNRTANETGWTALLGEGRGGPDVSAYAAPARAADLSRLPPAFVDAGSAEVFRDEAVGYASRIWAAGGVAELHVWPGGFHGFDTLAPHCRIAREAREARLQWLRRLLSPA